MAHCAGAAARRVPVFPVNPADPNAAKDPKNDPALKDRWFDGEMIDGDTEFTVAILVVLDIPPVAPQAPAGK